MSVTELFREMPTPEEATAEAVAAEVRANLTGFLEGHRESFQGHFPVGLGVAVQDRAHEIFLESLGIQDSGEGFIVIAGGSKLFVSELRFSEEEGGQPYHVVYSSYPFEYPGTAT